MNKDELIQKMLDTEQFPGCNMLQHGEMVRLEFQKIKKDQSQLPVAIQELYHKLKDSILPDSITDTYQLYHDCGKPLCKTQIDGTIRYLNHANVSAEIWTKLFPEQKLIARLMKHDMDFHILRSNDLIELWKLDIAPTLYFTAWAEIFANAKMFGGMESESFKIKKKRLISAGKYNKV